MREHLSMSPTGKVNRHTSVLEELKDAQNQRTNVSNVLLLHYVSVFFHTLYDIAFKCSDNDNV